MPKRRAYPTDRKQQIDDHWRAAVLSALESRPDQSERSVEWLALEIGADPGGLRRCLRPPPGRRPQNTSAYYKQINNLLGIYTTDGPREAALVEAFRNASENVRQGVLSILGLSPAKGESD